MFGRLRLTHACGPRHRAAGVSVSDSSSVGELRTRTVPHHVASALWEDWVTCRSDIICGVKVSVGGLRWSLKEISTLCALSLLPRDTVSRTPRGSIRLLRLPYSSAGSLSSSGTQQTSAGTAFGQEAIGKRSPLRRVTATVS